MMVYYVYVRNFLEKGKINLNVLRQQSEVEMLICVPELKLDWRGHYFHHLQQAIFKGYTFEERLDMIKFAIAALKLNNI